MAHCTADYLNNFSGGLGDYTTATGTMPCDSYQRAVDEQRLREERDRLRQLVADLTSSTHCYQSGPPINNSPKKEKKMTLSMIAKKLFDADTRVLIKAGILCDDLSVTEEGADFIHEFIVTQFKKELASEARKILRARKQEADEE